jgi:hypothetical protein
LSFWTIAGLEAIFFTLAGLGVAIYSAIRTGGLFYLMEVLLLKEYNLPDSIVSLFSLSAMVTSLLAFELYVLAHGFSKGRENKDINRSGIGLYLSLGVIVLAGVFTGFALIPELNSTFKLVFYTIIAVATGVAGGLIALYAGENIGFTFFKVETVRKNLTDKHMENYQKWREAAVKAYSSSHYALGSKKSTSFARNVAGVPLEPPTETPAHLKSGKAKLKETEWTDADSEEFVLAYNKIVAFVKENARLLRVTELDNLGTDKSETYLAFSRFILHNEQYLINNNFATAENIKKVKKYIQKVSDKNG